MSEDTTGAAAVLEPGADVLGVLDTPELESQPQEADAHRAIITSITRQDFDSGSTAIEVGLTSLDAAFDTQYRIFPPKMFIENVNVDPTTLPEGELQPDGKMKGNQKQQYSINISNSAKDADMQRLRAIAAEAGRTVAPGTQKPTTFDEWVALHNELLNGVEVIIRRLPDNKADDPRFKGRLRVTSILPASSVNNPKLFKKYRKAWVIE